MRRSILIIIVIFAGLFILGQFLFVPKTFINSTVIQALLIPRTLTQYLFNNQSLSTQLNNAQLENQSLRAQLISAESRPGIVKEEKQKYLQAPIYSVYPLNDSGQLIVAAGSAEAVSVGMVVVARPGIFLGEVTEVYEHQSKIRTLYDPDWELSARIGEGKIDSLFVGGRQPRLTLISRKKPITSGQEVILANKKYPYGLLLGFTGAVSSGSQSLFDEATLEAPYTFSELQEVFIIQ